MRIIAGDKIDSKVFSFYKSHHFSEVAKLVIKGSKFVLFVDLYYLSSWVVKQSLIRNFDVLMAVSAWPSQYPTVRIATYWNPEVFVLKKCFLQEVSFWMDNGHPSLQRNLTPRGNSSVSKWWTGLCLVWWSWFELWIWPHRPVLCLDWNRPQVSFELGFNAICSAIQELGLAPGNASTVL